MYRILLLSVLIFVSALTVTAQELIESKKDTAVVQPQGLDSIRPAQRLDNVKPKYINQGKIAGRKAIFSSLMVPGLGQLRNGITVYRLAKVGAIYVGGTMLTLSYIDNNKNYHFFLKELIYVREHEGKHPDGSLYVNVDEQGLISAKDLFRRNREVVIFSLVGLYLLNAVEAYVDARLKYFNVDDVSIKFSPDLINTNTMYGFNKMTPGIKLTLTF
ncbi:DUF5683 domain-containing protein [Pedobacter psychroterrae]|uniref:DUF5683 domain-containing protein n=1 Tax=Pedobacter psychroterrae TaxID=2530453 RepID=A0A4R0NGY8_9SPHI|nr:DUF5683 domain-containing protein [Pedobacter psychroterrae]TCC98004.1 hypothetical protein EZ437_19345 [Pedobacter psychroterrae]